jgi:hypothetical protein
MNISNILYAFTEDLVNAAGAGTPLKDVQIHADIYEEIKPGKTIRVDDVRRANPVILGSGQIQKQNAVVPVHFLKMPVTQKVSDRLAARQVAEDMADVWLQAYFNDPKLSDSEGNHRVCNIGEVFQFNEWIKPGTVKIPVVILNLLINPRK